MKLLVTGGCGFIGSNFIRQRLTEDGSPLRKLVNFDALTYAGNPANLADLASDPRYVFVHGNIGDDTLVARLLAEHAIDAIINFAAESHVDRSIASPQPFIETNVVGTLHLLNATLKHYDALPADRRSTFRFLHVSTDEVYGSLGPQDPPFAEQTPYAPNSPYSASKAASDHLVRAYHRTYDLPVLTVNCSNNYGPYQHSEKLIPRTIINALQGKPITLYGDGLQIRDWIHVEDNTTAIWLVLQKGHIGETYNIGGSNEQTNIDMAKSICSILDRIAPRADRASYAQQITHVTDRPGHDRRYAINCKKIRSELRWIPQKNFTTTLEQTASWYLGKLAKTFPRKTI
ncbi:dTDP-glucose 4,6-dehydratase [Opitutaceae bacterium TAV4]|nr:dTDP-glucose 4,6-dehydratase [Opitutaceae bacterium TAV4]RRK01571.1 dTDP-glucose 4,6-dehydratase [Opitutaceae bacterium TAV3]